MTNDNLTAEQLEAANVRGTIVELERQRNNAFTTAAQKAGEYEKLRVVAGEFQKKLGEADERIKSLESALFEMTEERNAVQEDLDIEKLKTDYDGKPIDEPRKTRFKK